ncbi:MULTISPECIES: hypothetical protein [Sorangium]|uniref:Uncharacterized protein n=1 Tax=Sorangium atrum TaxID=2995308 RepID=A0ABT5CIJ7_9BACT|nr:hypothetical protein [Sorangium aterium]MDC0685463.1 hypothetical protein [Sorangium aterium]
MNEQIKVEVEVESKQETVEERPARLTVEVPTELQAGLAPQVCTCPPGCCGC